MTRSGRRARLGVMVAAVAAFALPALMPQPAAAYWVRRHWYVHRCCYGPPVVLVPAPVVVVRRPVWVLPHWDGPYYVPGHWR